MTSVVKAQVTRPRSGIETVLTAFAYKSLRSLSSLGFTSRRERDVRATSLLQAAGDQKEE